MSGHLAQVDLDAFDVQNVIVRHVPTTHRIDRCERQALERRRDVRANVERDFLVGAADLETQSIDDVVHGLPQFAALSQSHSSSHGRQQRSVLSTSTNGFTASYGGSWSR